MRIKSIVFCDVVINIQRVTDVTAICMKLERRVHTTLLQLQKFVLSIGLKYYNTHLNTFSTQHHERIEKRFKISSFNVGGGNCEGWGE